MPDDATRLLRDAGALLTGHFQYTSGRHGALYVEKFRLLENPEATTELCGHIAERFRAAEVAVVAGPTTGGTIIAFETARQLRAKAFSAERNQQGEGRIFARGFTFASGARTLVVDDVLTTGGSLRDTLAAVRTAGGEPVGVAVIVDRTGRRTDFGLPFHGCLTLDIETHAPEQCPLCKRQIPLTIT